MSVYAVKARKDSGWHVNGDYFILVEFQGIFSFFLNFSLSFEFLQRCVLFKHSEKV